MLLIIENEASKVSLVEVGNYLMPVKARFDNGNEIAESLLSEY